MRVHIFNDGKPGRFTEITNAETGEHMDYVTEASINIKADRNLPCVVLTVEMPVIDIVADAEIKQVCPCCKRAVDKDKQP